MSVIGRLDEQVDAVLISPLDKAARRKTEPREEEAPAEQATVSHHNQQTHDETVGSQNERADRDDLPVWLL